MSAPALPVVTAAAPAATPVRVVPAPQRVRDRSGGVGDWVRVADERDIIRAVAAAREAGGTVRAVGSGGSKNDCFRTSGTTLSFRRYDRVVAVQDNRVTVQAGATVGALNAALRRHGLALPTHGEWAGATLAGAVATGTHGGAVGHGVFSSSVRSLRLVTGTGDPLEVHRGSELFPHAAVSLGMLGIISTITFDCVEQFHLELVMQAVPFEWYLRDHAAACRANEFYSAVWIPTARRVITFAANRVPMPPRLSRRRERFCAGLFALAALSRRWHVHAFPGRWFTGTAVDTWDRIISPIGDGSQRIRLLRFLSRSWKAAEFAVRLPGAEAALVALDRFLTDHRHALTNPMGLRASAADGFSLSPCYGVETFWIDTFYRDRNGFGRQLRELFEGLGARCHWGKHVGLSTEHLRRQYPRWDAFRAARTVLDPDGVFANTFTRRFDS